MKDFVIPDDYPEIYNSPNDFEKCFLAIAHRFDFIDKTGIYAYVCNKWVKPLAKWIGSKKCLEIMAGSGVLTYALRENGVNIIATDDFSWELPTKNCIITPINMDAKTAVNTFKGEVDIVIASWPPKGSDLHKALLDWPKDKHIIYIGEIDGCTACEEFTDHFIRDKDHSFKRVSALYKPWFGLHDVLLLGKYKTQESGRHGEGGPGSDSYFSMRD